MDRTSEKRAAGCASRLQSDGGHTARSPSIMDTAERLLRDWLETYGYTTDDIERLKPCPLDLEARTRTYLSSSESKEQYPDTEADGVVFCGKCGAKR